MIVIQPVNTHLSRLFSLSTSLHFKQETNRESMKGWNTARQCVQTVLIKEVAG